MLKICASGGGNSSKRGKGVVGSDNKRADDDDQSNEMKAVVTTDLGGPDVLKLRSVPKPKPKANQVLVQVAFAGVNRPDTHQRETMLAADETKPPDQRRSEYLGLECSGKIVERGAGLSQEDKETWTIGKEVCAITNGGSYAEYVAVPVGQLLPIPSNLSLREAAKFPQVACTVWSELFMKPKSENQGSPLSAGQTLLIHGGSSGIGTFAIQMAKSKGVIVYVTASTAEKRRACENLKADACMKYEDFVTEIRRLTNGKGVDVILDCYGEKYFLDNISCLRSGGRLVIIGPCCIKAEHDSYKFFLRRHVVTACALRNRSAERKAEIVKEVRSHVWPAIEGGYVRAIDNKIPPFEFSKAADAHKRLERGNFTGKILLWPGNLQKKKC